MVNENNWALWIKFQFEKGETFIGVDALKCFTPNRVFSGTPMIDMLKHGHRVGRMKFEVFGFVERDQLEMEIRLPEDIPLERLACSGVQIDPDCFEGTYNSPCPIPETCGCNGFSGPFRVTRRPYPLHPTQL